MIFLNIEGFSFLLAKSHNKLFIIMQLTAQFTRKPMSWAACNIAYLNMYFFFFHGCSTQLSVCQINFQSGTIQICFLNGLPVHSVLTNKKSYSQLLCMNKEFPCLIRETPLYLKLTVLISHLISAKGLILHCNLQEELELDQ